MQLLDLVRTGEESLSVLVLADDIGPHKIMWATDYPYSDDFFARFATDDWATAPTISPEGKHGYWPGVQ